MTSATAQDRVLQKVRALLAKAESTTYAEEATALTAKAHELIAAHAIDIAMVQERTGRGDIITKMLFIEAPYPKEKFLLLSAAARANNCRALLGLGSKGYATLRDEERLEEMDAAGEFAWVVGYRSDLESVELLFTSLLLQAVNVMVGQGAVTDRSGKSRTKSFRRSFLVGFSTTIDHRLDEVRLRAAEVAESNTDAAVLPVLASRTAAVEGEMNEQFPQTKTLRTSISNARGVEAGMSAGRRADIGTSRIGARRGELG